MSTVVLTRTLYDARRVIAIELRQPNGVQVERNWIYGGGHAVEGSVPTAVLVDKTFFLRRNWAQIWLVVRRNAAKTGWRLPVLPEEGEDAVYTPHEGWKDPAEAEKAPSGLSPAEAAHHTSNFR